MSESDDFHMQRFLDAQEWILDEAQAYLTHPLLGERLRECCQALLDCGSNWGRFGYGM